MFQAEYSSGSPLRMLVDLRASVENALGRGKAESDPKAKPVAAAKPAVAPAGGKPAAKPAPAKASAAAAGQSGGQTGAGCCFETRCQTRPAFSRARVRNLERSWMGSGFRRTEEVIGRQVEF